MHKKNDLTLITHKKFTHPVPLRGASHKNVKDLDGLWDKWEWTTAHTSPLPPPCSVGKLLLRRFIVLLMAPDGAVYNPVIRKPSKSKLDDTVTKK